MDQITEEIFEKKILGKEGAGLFDFVKKTYNNIADRFKGKRLSGFNNESTKTLKDYGNDKIIKLTIAKKPIHAVLDRFINILSFNKWDSLKNKYGFDKMFHLCLIATLENGKKIYIEKIDALTISTVDKISGKDTLTLDINDIPNITLNDLVLKARADVGDNLFFDYDPFKNNCQNFVSYLLNSIGKYGESEKSFIYQDVSEMAKELSPITKSIMKGITDLGQIGNRFLGRGEFILVKVIIDNPTKNQLKKVNMHYTKKGNKYTFIINNSLKGNKRVKDGKITFIYNVKSGGKVDIKLKDRLPKLEQEAYKFLGTIPKMEIYKPTGRKDFKNLRAEWEKENRPEMIKILNMGKEDREKYRDSKIKEYNEWKLKNKDLFDESEKIQRNKDIKNVEKAKKYHQLKQLLEAVEKRKEEASKLDNPKMRQDLVKQYTHDQKMIEEYKFYQVDNPLLRDQLDKQYLKMFDNMLTKPKIYGYLKEGTIKKTDPDTIRYVYEHYGKPGFNWDTFINDSLPSILNEGLKMIPGVGQIYKPIGDAIISANDEDNAKRGAVGEESILPDIDYSKGYELFDKSNEQANKESEDLNLEEQNLLKQQKELIGSGKKDLYLYTVNKIAVKNGYKKGVKLANDGKHKLIYDGVKFGNKDSNDYILYWIESGEKIAKKHRKNYLKRSANIKGNWKADKLSPNNLSRVITWDLNNVL